MAETSADPRLYRVQQMCKIKKRKLLEMCSIVIDIMEFNIHLLRQMETEFVIIIEII